jgi:hypothetical protein
VSRLLYFDLFSGASGDMLLGALVDAGLSMDALTGALDRLSLSGYEVTAEGQIRHGLSGTKVHVRDTAQEHPARHLSDVQHLVEGSSLSDAVKATSLRVFERLARVEAGIHGASIDEVHFHEISAVDSLVDVVGFVSALEILGVERVYASPVPLGSGSIETAHGRIPVPAPATLALLAEVGAPSRPHPAETEIVTPTAAALLSEVATFERPAMRLLDVGYGFGEKEFDWANGLRVWVGEAVSSSRVTPHQVVEIACNIDDTTGEALGYAMERLFAAGALDVWFTPIQMKKNRPAFTLTVLAAAEDADRLAALVLRETSTLGVRLSPVMERIVAVRRSRQVELPWGLVRVKEKWLSGERHAVSPEYEDCARIAREQDIPLLQVFEAAARRAADVDQDEID